MERCHNAGMKTSSGTIEAPAARLTGRSIRNDLSSGRLAREWQTMELMTGIFCRDRHAVPGGLCPECRQFLDYARQRLERCRFGPEKPTCAKCPVHCYQRERREQVRTIMRAAGPRMLWKHPLLSLRHRLDGFRRRPSA